MTFNREYTLDEPSPERVNNLVGATLLESAIHGVAIAGKPSC